ncbi:DUF6030 family protein [Rhizobium oryziradicis]|uniref:Exopolysaccharide biosynthesis protein n=1 Tax=Rhizobium oryziradicis TaxID=1867956 RepID=A0A1Q8ZVB5_9HYPH|nr:DUF6030 family protein [Rhizobium oryziradicis]OLP45838.1 hypothetical protein BJF95_12055 [Rhizobium oryziradicis]
MTQTVPPNVSNANDTHLRTPQQRRRGVWLFLGIVLMLAMAIGATVLLANGERNLRLLATRLDIRWPVLAQEPPQNTLPQPARGNRLESKTVVFPSRMFLVPALREMAVFVRTIPFSGETLCQKLNADGLSNKGWAQNAYNSKVFDCSVEMAITPAEENADAPSFFMVVNGDKSGQITQIRWKIIDVKDNPKVWAMYLSSISSIARMSRWSDFTDEFERMRALLPFNVNHFGIGFKLSKEMEGNARYNIMLMPENDGELQQNTRAILDSQSTFPSPPLLKAFWPRQRLG